MSVSNQPAERSTRFAATDARTQEEVGGILERAFRRESGRVTRRVAPTLRLPDGGSVHIVVS